MDVDIYSEGGSGMNRYEFIDNDGLIVVVYADSYIEAVRKFRGLD